MEILKAYQTKNRCYKQNNKVQHVGILVHSTGAVNRNLKRYVDSPARLGVNQYGNHWNSEKADKAVHAFIGWDKDKKIIVAQTLPLDISCWGSGKGKKGSRNRTHIQFEICQGSDDDAAYYKAAIAVAEEYCAHLCRQYGWSADAITSHREEAEAGYASNHGDPCSWMKKFGDSMDKFRARVKARLNGAEMPSDAPKVTEEQTVEEKKETQPAAACGTYKVKKGDNLWDIAKAQLGSGSKYTLIMELNGLKTDKLKVGQVLKIPGKAASYTTYTVKKGDNLWDIAGAKLGDPTRYKEIKTLNGLKSDALKIGQVLKIPKA